MEIMQSVAAACAVGAILAFGAAPAPARADSLQDALVQAYHNNPALLAERARLRATDEGVAQALSNWRPTVSISGDAGYQFRSRTTTGRDKGNDFTLPRTVLQICAHSQ